MRIKAALHRRLQKIKSLVTATGSRRRNNKSKWYKCKSKCLCNSSSKWHFCNRNQLETIKCLIWEHLEVGYRCKGTNKIFKIWAQMNNLNWFLNWQNRQVYKRIYWLWIHSNLMVPKSNRSALLMMEKLRSTKS